MTLLARHENIHCAHYWNLGCNIHASVLHQCACFVGQNTFICVIGYIPVNKGTLSDKRQEVDQSQRMILNSKAT